MENKKLSIEQLKEFWKDWEHKAGESFIDYFVDDNINSIGLILGYWAAKYPDLFEYIMDYTNECIVWNYVQDGCNKYNISLVGLVEEFYKVYTYKEDSEIFNEKNYDKSIIPWCDLICGIDIYYQRFLDWYNENNYNLNLSKYGK